MRTYIFEAKLLRDEKIVREIEIPENASLYKFAEAIVGAYNFDFDHPFGFFDNVKDMYKSKEAYELFADLKNQGIEPTGAKSVKETKISDAFPIIGKKMLFYFDYGDNWEFLVSLKGFGEKDSKATYPRIVGSKGEAPEQYPMEEDEEESEKELTAEDLFDDCPICQVEKEAHRQGRSTTLDELKQAFKKANEK